MTRFAAGPLQAGVRDVLQASLPVMESIASLYDTVPETAVSPYLYFGASEEVAEDTKTLTGRSITFDLGIVAGSGGQCTVKSLFSLIDTALKDGGLAVSGWSLVSLSLVSARVDANQKTLQGTIAQRTTEGVLRYKALLFQQQS
ncbi:hypothetical protein GCM10017044_10890 [Kordiimonas sediminis]|uniref:DUF3168 domain-containing protein n=2 Tax=Kordiimonas sediminis TaxID=1735581 RepID=A0A919AQC5_9PROT|nr:hypothetical protein GCM10017044_10890 [Kordiimonas sediminis]